MSGDRCELTGREFDDGRLGKGRFPGRPGFRPYKQLGLGTREQRHYLVLSLANQPNRDRERAAKLLAKMDAKR